MTKKLIIGFGCKRMRGKDTSANIMAGVMSKVGIEVRRDAFAASLKNVCREVFGFTDEQVNGDQKEIIDPFWEFTPRWAMQTLGTEAFRHKIRDDVWVKSLERRFNADPRSVLISDLRFENEALSIKRLGGVVIRCDRNVPYDEERDQHASETGLNDFTDWNFILDNNGSIEELEVRLQNILLEILAPTLETIGDSNA